MVKNVSAQCLKPIRNASPKTPVIGVFSPCDPRIDAPSRKRVQNIIKMVADTISGQVVLPDHSPVPVVYSDVLVDGETQADLVARQFRDAGVDIIICSPDTWAFPQLTTISLLQQFRKDTPFNVTCGNSGPKPGVVYAHALTGAITQYGKLVSLNVGTWSDTGMNPRMSAKTAELLIDWCYAAVAVQAVKGRRVMVLGHDSMGMETALSHVIPTRNTFGLEITRLDMKLFSDMLGKKAYDKKELKDLRGWFDKHVGKRLELKSNADSERFNQSLAMYLINRDLLADLNAIGGGFMSQLEWGSDPRGTPLPVADAMESLFNSTFDHNGPKPVLPYATEADTQGLMTMLFMTYLSGGNPPLFMDFRKLWEAWEIKSLAKKLKVSLPKSADYLKKGLVDGNNSGSASFDWAGKPGTPVKQLMNGIALPLAEGGYFPGGGNSVTFMSPAGIEGIAARLTYSALNNKFTMIWDETHTTKVPLKLEKAMCKLTTPEWPHTFVVPQYAGMTEYKQFAPANHFHMTWNLPVARLQYWMDLTGVLNCTPWSARPSFVEGTDRPQPLLHLQNGGEMACKMLQ